MLSCSKSDMEITNDNLFDNLFSHESTENGNYLNISKTCVKGESASISVDYFPTDSTSNTNLKVKKFLNSNLNGNNSLFITPSEENDFKSFKQYFGVENMFPTSDLKSTDDEYGIYFPEIIAVTNVNELEKLSSPPYDIKWNRDDKNPNGKVVIAIIHRGVRENEIVRYEEYSTVKVVDDTGKSTITYDDLSKFPQNSELDIIIGRGNQDEIDGIIITATTKDLVNSKNY